MIRKMNKMIMTIILVLIFILIRGSNFISEAEPKDLSAMTVTDINKMSSNDIEESIKNMTSKQLGNMSAGKIRAAFNISNDIIKDLTDDEKVAWGKILDASTLEEGSHYNQGSSDKIIQENTYINALMSAQTTDNNRKPADGTKTNGTGETNKELKEKNVEEIEQWLIENESTYLSDEVKAAWKDTIDKSNANQNTKSRLKKIIDGESWEGTAKQVAYGEDPIYQNPEMTDTTKTPAGTIEGVIQDADKFLEKKKDEPVNPLNQNEGLQKFSQTISGILMTVGTVIAVIIGGILGIKFMTGTVEQKAEIKQLLIPYIVGCIIVFGAITIWTVAVNFGSQLDTTEVGSANSGTDTSKDDSTDTETSSTGGKDTQPSDSSKDDDTPSDEKNEGASPEQTGSTENKENSGGSGSSTNSGNSGSSGTSSKKENKIVAQSIVLDQELMMLDKHHYKTTQLSYSIYPKNVTDKNVTWKSSNTAVATVNKKGEITAKAEGKTVITVTTSNGKKAKCTLTVIGHMTRTTEEEYKKKGNKGGVVKGYGHAGGYWNVKKVSWSNELVESYINNAEKLCKTGDYNKYPEGAPAVLPYYTGSPYVSGSGILNTTLYKRQISKGSGISATKNLILVTSTNQMMYLLRKGSDGKWSVVISGDSSTGPMAKPNGISSWDANNIKTANSHNRFDFYIGAIYGRKDARQVTAYFQFWQCSQGSYVLEAMEGRLGAERYYAHRAVHNGYINYPEKGSPSSFGCPHLPATIEQMLKKLPDIYGTRVIVY